MNVRKFFSNSIQPEPKEEIKNTFGRYESDKFSKGSSIKGRGVCLLLVPVHAVGIVAKPLIYTIAAAGALGNAARLTAKIAFNKIFTYKDTYRDSKRRNDSAADGLCFAINVIISPFGQIAQVTKAAAGILYPPAYFKKPRVVLNNFNNNNNFNHVNNNLNNIYDNINNNLNNNINNNFNNNLNNNLNPLNNNNFNNLNNVFNNDNDNWENWNFDNNLNNNQNINNNPIIYHPPIHIDLNPYPVSNNDFVNNNGSQHNLTRSRYRVTCPINYPVENSLEALGNFAAALRRGANDLAIVYVGQQGVDAGGLGRDYVYRLFNGVATALHLKDGLVYQQGSNEAALRNIGVSLSFLLKEINLNDSSSEFTIGDALISTYFKGLLTFNYNEIHANVDNLSEERVVEILRTAEDTTATQLHAFLNWDGTSQETPEGRAHVAFANAFVDANILQVEGITANQINVAHLQTIKETFLTEFVDGAKEQVRALQTIAQGMNLTQASWERIQAAGAQRVQDHIQGAFDNERVKESLQFFGASQEIQQHIKDWVDSKSEEELRNFLAYINGSPAIKPIQVSVGNYATINVHSCYSSIDIPVGSPLPLITRILDEYCAGNAVDANFDNG